MLTGKQDNFCIAFVELGNANEAYKVAYPKAKAWKDGSVRAQASLMFKNPNILKRIEEIKAPLLKNASCTFDEHMSELQSLRELAKKAENYPAAITAETNRGKAAGHYTEKVEHSGNVTINVVKFCQK